MSGAGQGSSCGHELHDEHDKPEGADDEDTDRERRPLGTGGARF
ncbi:hypothetical protein ACWEAF_42650 [Streptomyces sp. NPDC005071]